MISNYVLRPTSWKKGGDEPEAVSFTPDADKGAETCIGFIEGRIAARPCVKRNGLALKGFRGDAFSVVRRGSKEEELIPCEVATVIFGGDKVIVSGNEYTFFIESIVGKKQKLSDDEDDDDDISESSSSLFSSSSSSLFSSSGNIQDDNDDMDLEIFTKEQEDIYNALIEMYPDHNKNELSTIAKNTHSVYEATITIFDPNEVDITKTQQLPSQPPPPPSSTTTTSSTNNDLSQSDDVDLPSLPKIEKDEDDDVDPFVKKLVEEFPGITIDQATMAFEAADKEEKVARQYLSELMASIYANGQAYGEGQNTGAKLDSPLDQLQEIFPNLPEDVLSETLKSCNNNVEAAANRLSMRDENEDVNLVAQQQQQYQQPPPAVAVAAPYANYNYNRGAYNEAGMIDEKDMRGMTVNVDVNEPWQSSNEMVGTYKQYIFDQVKFIKSDYELQHTAVCIQLMIENEQKYNKNYYCFYHSYSVAHLMYELNSLIATIIYDLDVVRYEDTMSITEDFVFPPVPRVLYKPFTVIKTFDQFSKFCTHGGRNDGDPAHQAVGVSVSTSIFSTSSEAPPIRLFRGGYSANGVVFDNLMKNLLTECGFDSKKASDIIHRINATAKKYDFPFGLGGWDHGIESRRATGHMLQIFINKKIVDKYVYPSEPFGYKIGTKSMSETLNSGGTNGQARIYINPDLFGNGEDIKTFYYCADAKFNENRKEFVLDLKRQLADIFSDMETREMIRKNVREKYGKIGA